MVLFRPPAVNPPRLTNEPPETVRLSVSECANFAVNPTSSPMEYLCNKKLSANVSPDFPSPDRYSN